MSRLRIRRFNQLFLIFLMVACSKGRTDRIDRYSLVTRHNIRHSEIDPLHSLSVGNGEFAYTADITGMQSFPEFHEQGIPLGTQSQWGWHSFPNPENYTPEDVMTLFSAGSDSVPYPFQYINDADERKNTALAWLRENPHRLHLGLIGMRILKDDSSQCTLSDIKNPLQQLDLWTGELRSSFEIDGEKVEVITYCHQELDMVSFRISSGLIAAGQIQLTFTFPYARHEKFSPGYDLNSPEKHQTALISETSSSATIKHTLDSVSYFVKARWRGEAVLNRQGEHKFILTPSVKKNTFEISCLFSTLAYDKKLPSFTQTGKNNRKLWKAFWESGGAVDFSACTDPRAAELERRVVLSQYLTKIQCSGSLPPQETGLTYNSWYGKFHLEMHWWHAAHFILWDRPELMEKQLAFYSDIFDQANNTAQLQGYKGVRWPKMTDPEGRESPSSIGPFLIWQQPHIIYLSELLCNYYDQDPEVLDRYKKLVFATADFMASYARWDSFGHRYVLGPPLIPAQERFDLNKTINPVFELVYWRWGLVTAQRWRERLGMKRDSSWQTVLDHLSPLPVQDSLYLFTENAKDSYTNPEYLSDHPIVLGITGLLPSSTLINKEIMLNTLEKVVREWDWQSAWGWDFPLAAMNAASMGYQDLAADLLLMDSPKNRYLLNGHNYQDRNLSVYLPGNGALLTAIAMMCTFRNERNENGFPLNGKWNITYENIHDMY